MSNMFSGQQNKKIPATLHECSTVSAKSAVNIDLNAKRLSH